MKLISALLLSCTVLVVPLAARGGTAQMPKAIQGTWYPNNSEGKKQCAAYRQQQNVNNKILALVISPTDAKSFAEYGEYTGYELQKVNTLSRQSWKLATKLLIEGDAPEERKIINMWAKLERGQLYWNDRPTGGSDRRYFKCL
jgi:hypothetical protein